MIEALACGTPIIACPFGSVPEVVEDGATGFLVRDVDSAAKAVQRLDRIARAKCREAFERRFTVTRMTEDYLAVYDRIINGEPQPVLPPDGDLSWTRVMLPSSTT